MEVSHVFLFLLSDFTLMSKYLIMVTITMVQIFLHVHYSFCDDKTISNTFSPLLVLVRAE